MQLGIEQELNSHARPYYPQTHSKKKEESKIETTSKKC